MLGTNEVTALESNDDICWDCSYGKDQGVCVGGGGGISGETRKRLWWTQSNFKIASAGHAAVFTYFYFHEVFLPPRSMEM